MVSPTYCVALAIVLRPPLVRSLRLFKKTTSWQPWWQGCLSVLAFLLLLPGCIPDPDSPPVSENPALDLASLQVQEGGQDRPLSPAFSPTVTSYVVSVSNQTTSVAVTATLANPQLARMRINNQSVSSGQAVGINLSLGSNPVAVLVEETAPSGQTRIYNLVINRAAPGSNRLASLVLSTGSLNPSFNGDQTSYSASVPFTTTQVIVTATAEDPAAQITINNQSVPSGQPSPAIPLNVGANNIVVVVTAQNGSTRSYTVVVTRQANVNLASLAVSAGALSPPFNKDVTEYQVNVPNETASTTITATIEQAGSTLAINGQPVASGQVFGPVPLNVGPNSFAVSVMAPDRITVKTYTVVITRAPSSNALLSTLTVTPGAMIPPFSPGTTTYTVINAGLFTTTANVTATVQEPNATITINGMSVASGTTLQVPLPTPSTLITILVRAQDTVTTVTYSVTVNK